jgi:nucleoid-associated protein YgaU
MADPKPGQAYLVIHWVAGDETIPCQYNPTELQLEKAAQFGEIAIPGLTAPLQQFVRGQAETLTVELFFDTSDQGMGLQATSVTEQSDQIYALTRIEPKGHAPPTVTFHWGDDFPGHQLPKKSGNQRRDSFTGVVTNVRQHFTLWSRLGKPLRAKLNVTIKEYYPLQKQLDDLNPTSPDRSHSYVLVRGETLAHVAARFYLRSDDWRYIANGNEIEDPRRLNPGLQLRVPPILPGAPAP